MIESTNIFAQLVQWTYSIDTSTNVCPSMHVMGCIGLLLTCWDMKGINDRKGHTFQIILASLISLSTMFIKQHSFIDVVAAIPIALLGWWVSYGDAGSFEDRKFTEVKRHLLRSGRILTIPNILSFARLCLIPVIVVMYLKGRSELAVALLLVSALTDVADGVIAERCSMGTDLGKILDPTADKITQFVLIYMLTSEYPLLWMLLATKYFKGWVQAMFGFILLQRKTEIRGATSLGKLSTAVVYLLLIALMLAGSVSALYADKAIIVCEVLLVLTLIADSKNYVRELYSDQVLKIRNAILVGIGILMWVAVVLVVFVNRDKMTAEGIAGIAPDNLFLAALALLAAFALKSLTIVFSSGVLFAASAIIFPLPMAFCVNFLGLLIIETIPYVIGRKGGPRELDRICERYPKIHMIRDAKIGNEILFTLMLRINVTLNYDICSIYLGARKLKSLNYYIGSLIGMMPLTILNTLLGVGLEEGDLGLSTILVVVTGVLMVISFWFFGRKIAVNERNKKLNDGQE